MTDQLLSTISLAPRDHTLYEPPRFRGDGKRVKALGQERPRNPVIGDRVGHLTVVGTDYDVQILMWDHVDYERRIGVPVRGRCLSSYCFRCSPGTAYGRKPDAYGFCTVQCDCGSAVRKVDVRKLKYGWLLSCGSCAKSCIEGCGCGAFGKGMQMSCGCWWCTTIRFESGMTVTPIRRAVGLANAGVDV